MCSANTKVARAVSQGSTDRSRTIDAVLFDMDGVLVDSEPVHERVTIEALNAYGLPMPDDAQWQRIFLGRPDRDGLRDWFALHRIDLPVETIMADKLARFEARFEDLVQPFEDGQWLARELHARDVPLALVTGARRDEADLVLRHYCLSSVFRATVTADDVTVGKPDPEPYLSGARLLGVSPDRCLIIEDSFAGVTSANAVDAEVIVVDRLGMPERFAPRVPVPALDDRVLVTILEQMASLDQV